MQCYKFTRSLPACLPPVSLSLSLLSVCLSQSGARSLCLWLCPLVTKKQTPNVWLFGLLGRKIETGVVYEKGRPQLGAGLRALEWPRNTPRGGSCGYVMGAHPACWWGPRGDLVTRSRV